MKKWVLTTIFGILASSTSYAQSERNLIFVSKDYEEYMQKLEGRTELDPDLVELKAGDSLSDAQQKANAEPLTPLQEKIAKRARLAQTHLTDLLDDMIRSNYDPSSDRASEEFYSIVDEIVKLTFYAETEVAFYERLYIINQSWLTHPEEIERFTVLDERLRDKALQIETFQRGMREAIIVGSTWVGAIAGGYLVYKFTAGSMTLQPTQTIWQKGLRLITRISFIGFGAWIGSYAGQTLGFLGSSLLFKSYQYSDPIDLNYPEDLRDYLDILNELEGPFHP